jgi:glycosyltransferase involved in cell wall biosynthesis
LGTTWTIFRDATRRQKRQVVGWTDIHVMTQPETDLVDVAVIICTHNPRRDYLARTLEALKSQTLPIERWEVLLVDNASDVRLEHSWDITWHPSGRHVREEMIGLTAARVRAIKESRADLLVFVDDDNVLASDFLEQALTIVSRNLHLGVVGAGLIQPEFAVPPPPEVLNLLSLLALRNVSHPTWSNHYGDWRTIPWGAGLCVTREVAGAYTALISRLRRTTSIGRNRDRLYTGEDDLFAWVSTQLGKGFGIFPTLVVTHLIPSERLTRRYFLKLIRDKATSSGIVDYQLSGLKPPAPTWIAVARMLAHGVKNGWFPMRCRFAEALGQREAVRLIERGRLLPNAATPSEQGLVTKGVAGVLK